MQPYNSQSFNSAIERETNEIIQIISQINQTYAHFSPSHFQSIQTQKLQTQNQPRIRTQDPINTSSSTNFFRKFKAKPSIQSNHSFHQSKLSAQTQNTNQQSNSKKEVEKLNQQKISLKSIQVDHPTVKRFNDYEIKHKQNMEKLKNQEKEKESKQVTGRPIINKNSQKIIIQSDRNYSPIYQRYQEELIKKEKKLEEQKLKINYIQESKVIKQQPSTPQTKSSFNIQDFISKQNNFSQKKNENILKQRMQKQQEQLQKEEQAMKFNKGTRKISLHGVSSRSFEIFKSPILKNKSIDCSKLVHPFNN